MNVRSILQDGFWWNVGKLSITILTVGLMSAFAYFTSKEVFGAYQYILSVVSIVGIFSLPGLNVSLTRAVAHGDEGDFIPVAKTKLLWSSIGVCVLVGFALWYLAHSNTPLGLGFMVAAIALPFLRTSELFASVWHGRSDFKKKSIFEIISGVFTTVTLILAVIYSKQLIWIVIAYFFSHTIIKSVFFFYTKNRIQNQQKNSETVRFGKHLSVINGVEIFVDYLDKILLWHFLGPAQVAIYAYAQLPIERLNDLMPVQALALPTLSKKNISAVKRQIMTKVGKLLLVIFPIVLLVIFLGPIIFKLLFPTYLESVIYFQVLAVGLAFAPLRVFTTGLITSLKKRELYILRTVGPLLRLLTYAILIPILGIWGIIIAFFVFKIVDTVLAIYFFKRI